MVPWLQTARAVQVRFHGEEGIDMGGVTREWYDVMAKAICDPNLALFVSLPERAATYQPSKNAVIQNESMVNFRDYFRFCGRFVGKSLIDGQQLTCYFTRSFYKHMLAVPLTLKDLEHVDPEYHKSLMYILEHDVEETCPDTTFVTEVDFFGRKDVVELKPGGTHIMVRCWGAAPCMHACMQAPCAAAASRSNGAQPLALCR
jgi:E3 ubiquitin-protein ligase HUWE1